MNFLLIEKIAAWAQADENIRAVILEGSFASHARVDELSDYDINVFTGNADKYLLKDHWLGQIGEVLIYQKEQIQFYDYIVPTRLVLFRNRERIDFSFWSLKTLAEIVKGEKIYESYRNGFQVLVDKDNLAQKLPSPDGKGFAVCQPRHEQFLQVIYDFWFEAYCVARYLSRKDLWYAKLIENRFIKDHLFQMALWNHGAENDWKPDPILHTEGKGFEKWASMELIEDISSCFSTYDVEETWKSLLKMVGVFNRLARQTSRLIRIEYPNRVEKDVLEYLNYLKERPDHLIKI